jgi:hypothetical protein
MLIEKAGTYLYSYQSLILFNHIVFYIYIVLLVMLYCYGVFLVICEPIIELFYVKDFCKCFLIEILSK